jgi:polar amino acid transport system substrate-binding protein
VLTNKSKVGGQNMKKRIFGILLVFVMVLSMAACGSKDKENKDTPDTAKNDSAAKSDGEDTTAKDTAGDDSLQYIKDRGKLILGLDDAFPPMGFRDDKDNIVGFDIDLAKAVCEKLGIELELQPVKWEAKEQELNTKNIDCIWNGLSLTPEREEQLTMSKPYMQNNISLVVMNDSKIATMADMKGKSLAVQSGSSAEEALDAEENKAFKDSIGTVNGFDDYVTALMDMETGNSDAVLMDSIVADYIITSQGKDYKVLDETLLPDQYSVGFRKGDKALCEAVENALKELKADGTLAEISTKWFGSDITTIE